MPIKKISLYIAIGAIFLIPIFPLIVANTYFFPFITGKAFYFRVLTEIAFAAWVILAFLDPKYRPKVTTLSIAVTLFAFVALLADILGVNPIRSLWSNFERMEGWITIIHLWAFYIVSSSIFNSGEQGKKMWHRWMNFEMFIGIIVAFYGLFQLFGWAAIHQGSNRLDASLGNSAYMAIYMMINAFMAAYLYFVARKRSIANADILVWIYPIMALLFSFIVLETQTRGTILGLIGGAMLALFLYAILAPKKNKKSRLISGGVLVGIVLLGALFWVNRHQPFIQKNPVLGRFSDLSWNESSNQARQYIWPMAINGAMHRPLLGWGQENFNYIFNADYNPGMYAQEQWFDRAHNVFLDWLVNSGIVGLISYLSLYALFLFAVWKSELTIAEKSVLTGLLAGYFVHNIFVFDNLASYVLFFAALGFANSFMEEHREVWFGHKPVRLDAVEYIVAPITIVLFIGALYLYNIRPVEANTRLIGALVSCGDATQADPQKFQSALDVNTYVANQEIREQLLTCASNVIGSQQTAGPTKQAFYALAQSAVKDQVAATPKDARIYVLGGAFLTTIGQFNDAQSLLETGHRLSPAKQTLDFELATDYLNTNNVDKAVALLKQAYEGAPDFFQAKEAYAVSLVIAGKETFARQTFNNDPDVFNTQQMAGVYASLKEYDKAIPIYQKLAAASPSDVNLNAQLAQLQFAAGRVSDSIATLRALEKVHPELKDQIDAAIKQVQTPAK